MISNNNHLFHFYHYYHCIIIANFEIILRHKICHPFIITHKSVLERPTT